MKEEIDEDLMEVCRASQDGRLLKMFDRMEKKKMKKCTTKQCPILLGFELYFQGEDDEINARKELLPLIKKLRRHGNSIMGYKVGEKK